MIMKLKIDDNDYSFGISTHIDDLVEVMRHDVHF